MISLSKDSLPNYFWEELNHRGTAASWITIPETCLEDSKYWIIRDVEPDFPRPGYQSKDLSELGRRTLNEYYSSCYVSGYWTVTYISGKILCFSELGKLEHWLSTNQSFMTIINPDGKRCKITATPVA